MNITHKHTIADYRNLKFILSYDKAFTDKIKQFAPVKVLRGVKICNPMEIQLQHILMAWNVKSEDDLFNITAKCFGLDAEKIDKYPMIDFLRLSLVVDETAFQAGEMFKKLKRETKDSEMKEILSKFTTNNATAIFVEIMKASNGAYTQEAAASLSWKLAYDIIEAQTIEYDKQNAMHELQEKRMKNGTNKRK